MNITNPVGAAYSLVLPTTAGASGQSLTTNGSGVLSWTTSGGNATQLQSRNVAATAPTNGQVLMWNNAGTQWEPTDPPGGNPTLLTKSANFAVGTGDANRVFVVTALATATLPAVAAVPSGFKVTFKRVGPSNVTVDPNASETIDGALTKALQTNYAAKTIANTGSEWIIVDGGGTSGTAGCVPGQRIYSSAGTFTYNVTASQATNCTFTVYASGAGGLSGSSSAGGSGGAISFTMTAGSAAAFDIYVGAKGTSGGGGGGGYVNSGAVIGFFDDTGQASDLDGKVIINWN